MNIATLMKYLCMLQSRALHFDWVAPLLCRLFLIPVFWMAGTKKYESFSDIVSWFEYGLELPFPAFMAFMATATELAGAVLLTLGFATRLICIPLAFTMIVAAVTVHWVHGWQAILDPGAPFAPDDASEGINRLDRAKQILQEHGNYEWLTESGSFVVLNNGIEFAATYFVLLIVLITTGPGRYVSLDHWVREWATAKYYQQNS